MASEDFCELCELPLSTCVHGMPKPLPVEMPAKRPAKAPARVPGTPLARAGTESSGAATTTAKTPRAAKTTRAAKAPSAAKTRTAPRRRTPQEELRPHVLRVLQDAGGSLDAESLMTAMEESADGVLLAGDREATPQGEPRWQLAARYERRAMTEDGLLEPADASGVWALTAAGSQAATAPA